MDQSDRGSFRKKESLFKEFSKSCLGRLVITVAIMAIIAVVACLSKPSEKTMYKEMNDNILEWIQENDSLNTDWIDDAVNNGVFTFTTADTVLTPEQQQMMAQFEKHNRLEYRDHSLFATMIIYNSFHIEGKRCGIGVFGLVIPTVNFNDFLLRDGPMRKEYNKPVTQPVMDNDEYFGENPDLGGVFRYNGE